MTVMTSLDILYVTLTIFTAIVGTLLSIVLFKLIKVMGPILDILNQYGKIKSYISSYAQVPQIVKNKVFEFVSSMWKNKK